jgi:quercetin dioxygenase-like cupin family protein
MDIRPKPPTVKNPPEQFTGDVWFDVIASPQNEIQRMVVGLVRFAPGARTAWHSHAKGQTLQVTQGVARMQARGGRPHRGPRRTDRLHPTRRRTLARRHP